jgi:hypothetical protein
MTPAEYGFWQLCRDLSHKTGTLYFDGRNMAARFAGTPRNGLSKNYFYTLLKSMAKKGWFEEIKPRQRNRTTGMWIASVHRVLSHEEWVAKKGDAHCTSASEASPDSGTGVESPVLIDERPVPIDACPVPIDARPVLIDACPVPLSGHNPMVNLMNQSDEKNPMAQPEIPATPLSSFSSLKQEGRSKGVPPVMGPACPDSGTGAHNIPDFLEYDIYDRCWIARRDIGRAITPAEYEVMQRMNKERVRPQ